MLSILAWLGVSNAAELKNLLADSPPSSSSPTPYTPSSAVRTPDIPGARAGNAGNDDESKREPPTPSPDLTEEAFKAISAGDCLAVYDTGRGGTTSIDWSVDVPPEPVSCADERALVRVTATDTACPTSYGKSYWSYQSATTGNTTKLCLTRIYHATYCMLGQQSGDSISLGMMTAVACRREPVPVPYNQIMHITGVYRAPAGANANNCVRGAGDQTRYWAWLVDDGATLLCTTIYRGS
ncbi:LppU/SCO3897 family protein [Streptomyces sp. NPDC001780]